MSNHTWISPGNTDIIDLTAFENSYCTQPPVAPTHTADNIYHDNVCELNTYASQDVVHFATVNKPKDKPIAKFKVEQNAKPHVEPKAEPKTRPKVEPKVDPELVPTVEPKVEVKHVRRLVLLSEPIDMKPVAAAGLCMIMGACISNIFQ